MNGINKTVVIELEDLLKLIEDAAQKGINAGDNGSAVEYTAPGIAYHVFHDWLKSQPSRPTGPTFRGE